MKKKLFFVVVVVVVLLIFIVPKGKNDSVNVNHENYGATSIKTGVEYLKSKANASSVSNYNAGNKGEMYTFSHLATGQTPVLTDYRYIGDNPNNYVYFNCINIQDVSTCEIWRIIGVFDVDKGNGQYEQRIKLVRGETLENYSVYDSDNDNYWYSSDVNNLLNNSYYSRSGDALSYGLNESARDLIADSKYYLGGFRQNASSFSSLYGNVDSLYLQERSNDYYDSDNVLRNTSWLGKVGLMYPSDNFYIYGKGVNNYCFENPNNCYDENASNGWFYKSLINGDGEGKGVWFITPRAECENGDCYYNLSIYSNGELIESNCNNVKYISPTVYLRNDVVISNGNGSSDNPYQVQTKEQYIDSLDYELDDKVYYNNELYRVIEDSSKNSDYVVVMKDVPLNKKYTDFYNDIDAGMYPYYYSDTCCYNEDKIVSKKTSGCNKDFDTSTIKKLLDNWSNNELDLDDLVLVDGYKVRLITVDELVNNLSFERKNNSSNETYYVSSSSSPNFINNTDFSTWTMSAVQSDNKVLAIGQSSYSYYKNVNESTEVKPVINLKKSTIGNKNSYNIGDEINYKNNKYYIISNSNMDYVTVIKDKSLSKKQIILYGESIDEFGKISYSDCNDNECIVDYDSSNIKKSISYWIDSNFDADDLKEIDGYKGRLLKFDELVRNWNLKKNTNNSDYSSSEIPDWMYKYTYFLMDTIDNNEGYYVKSSEKQVGKTNLANVTAKYVVRPVIYLKKSAINKYRFNSSNNLSSNGNLSCTKKYKKIKNIKYSKYNIGQVINYNGDMYYVIHNSSPDDNYVTLLRDNFISNQEVYSDNTSEENAKFVYFRSNECMSGNKTGCTNDYSRSNVKKIIDLWIKNSNIEKDLVSIDGYKARILKADELFENLGYDIHNGISRTRLYKKTDDVPKWIYEKNTNYWSMTGYEDNGSIIFIINKNGSVGFDDIQSNGSSYVYNSYAIRPVINLDKCAIDGGCEIEEIEVEDGCLEDDGLISKVVVTVANTLKYLPQIIFIISIVLIVGGLGILGYNYYKSRRERR